MNETERIEAIWRNRVEAARLRVTIARDRLTDLRDQLQLPDYLFLYRNELQEEFHALSEYRRVLEIYTDLVATGKIPDEPHAERS